MPAFFYLASFLAYVHWRQARRASHSTPGRSCSSSSRSSPSRTRSRWWRRSSATTSSSRGGRRVRSSRSSCPYVPFALMTAGYLWLRYVLFGQVAREGALNARALQDFRILLDRHLRHVVAGSLDAPARGRMARCWPRRRCLAGAAPRAKRRAVATSGATFSTSARSGGRLACCRSPLPAITRRGTCISRLSAGRSCSELPSTRRGAIAGHQRGSAASASGPRSSLLFYLVPLRSPFASGAERPPCRTRSCATCARPRCRCPAGHPHRRRRARAQLGVGAAVRRASAVQRTDLRCACVHRFATRAQLLHGAVVRGDTPDDSRLVRRRRPRFRHRDALGSRDRRSCRALDGRDVPQLAVLIRSLLDMRRPEELTTTCAACSMCLSRVKRRG